jgi:hypothetical protein
VKHGDEEAPTGRKWKEKLSGRHEICQGKCTDAMGRVVGSVTWPARMRRGKFTDGTPRFGTARALLQKLRMSAYPERQKGESS